jgi:thiol:disulfide interchange protein DsbC
MRKKLWINLIAVLSMVTACSAWAQTTTQAADSWNKTDDVIANLQKRYPSTTFKNVKTSAVPGIFELTMGKNIGYVEPTGRYFFFGKLFDMQTQTDLTESPRAAASAVDFNKLPLKNAIKVKKGNGKRVFAVFSDPDCPYCKQLENTLSRMTNFTMYVFLFPIDSLHPEAANKAKGIWCSSDRAKAWESWMLDGIKPAEGKCETPIAKNIELAGEYSANGTPTLVHQNGQISAGAMPRDSLELWLNSPTEAKDKP